MTGFEPAASCTQTYQEHFFRSFLMVFGLFYSVTVTLWHSLKGLFPGVPGLSVVIYVVKNASRLGPVNIHRPQAGSVSRFRSSAL